MCSVRNKRKLEGRGVGGRGGEVKKTSKNCISAVFFSFSFLPLVGLLNIASGTFSARLAGDVEAVLLFHEIQRTDTWQR